jgi:predicted alpha/beta hydrolase
LVGHSLGGQLAALYFGMCGGDVPPIDGAVLVAAGSVYFRSYPFPGSLRVLAGTQLARAVSVAWGYFPGDKLRFGGRESRGVIRDWSTQARTGRYEFSLGSAVAEDLLHAAQGNVLAISVENDTLAPRGSVDHICGKLRSAQVSRWHYAPAPGVHIDHFRWVRNAQPVAERVRAWVERMFPVRRPGSYGEPV